jgi:hypothetical protein
MEGGGDIRSKCRAISRSHPCWRKSFSACRSASSWAEWDLLMVSPSMVQTKMNCSAMTVPHSPQLAASSQALAVIFRFLPAVIETAAIAFSSPGTPEIAAKAGMRNSGLRRLCWIATCQTARDLERVPFTLNRKCVGRARASLRDRIFCGRPEVHPRVKLEGKLCLEQALSGKML